MLYTVTFNPAIDYLMHLDRLTPGALLRSGRENAFFGGKGINVSQVLQRLGIENTALGFVAGFTGEALVNGLSAAGVRTDLIRLPQGLTRINVKLRADTETDINGRGPAVDAASIDRLFDKLRTLTPAIMLFKGANLVDWGGLMAASVISVLPVTIIFLFLQKYFLAGLMSGSVKG